MVRALALCTATCLVAASCGGGSPKLANHDQVYVVPASGGKAARLTGGEASAPAWSPDGRRLTVVERDGIAVLDRTGRSLAGVRLRRAAGPDQPSWSPDATRIAFAARRRPAED